MNKSLKKIASVLVFTVVFAICLSGCGNSSNTKKSITDYEKIVRSEAVSFKSYKKVNPLTDLSTVSLESAVDPDAETELHTAESDAKVYSKNTTTSQVIGEIEEDDEVYVIEKISGTSWYMIVFNGRVAYIQTSVLEAKTDSENSYNNYLGITIEETTEKEITTEHTTSKEDDTSSTEKTDAADSTGATTAAEEDAEETSSAEESEADIEVETDPVTPESEEGEN